MFGNAALIIGGKRYPGLSDVLAMSFARAFATTFSDEAEFAVATLSDGTEKVIGLDTVDGSITVGTLRPYRTEAGSWDKVHSRTLPWNE